MENLRLPEKGTPTPRRIESGFLPAVAVLELTYQCNHTCLFCSCPWYADGYDQRSEMGIDEWKALIRRLVELGVCDFAFTGGEPLLKNGWEEIVSFAASLAIQRWNPVKEGEYLKDHPGLHLISNGRCMQEQSLEFMSKHGVHLMLSLPGLRTYRYHTGAGNPDLVLDLFTMAASMGVETTVGVTVTRKNLFEVYETIGSAFLAGAKKLLLNRFLPGGRGLMHKATLSLGVEDIRKALVEAERALHDGGRYGHVGTELPRCIVASDDFRNLTVGTRCAAATDFFAVDPSGYLRVCNHSRVRLGRWDALEDIQRHPYWAQFALKNFLPAGCAHCPDAIRNCDGGCREAAHISGGRVDAPDPVIPLVMGSNGGGRWCN